MVHFGFGTGTKGEKLKFEDGNFNFSPLVLVVKNGTRSEMFHYSAIGPKKSKKPLFWVFVVPVQRPYFWT